ncbi:Double homeobox protein 4C [Manis javanica]|nr:Double homeobox protein 4C [Manis javanica]
MDWIGTSSGPVPGGSRRRRIVLKPSQRDALKAVFRQNPYPGITTRERLAQQLDVPESRIQIWFQNRRARHSAQQSSSGPDTPRKPDSLLLCLWLQHVVTRVYNSAFNAVDHDPGDQPRYQTPHRNAEGQFPTLQQVVQEPPWNPGHSPYMDWIGTSSGPVPGGSRRRRIVLKPSQRDALKAVFRQNPYPGITTRERLAQQLDVPESRIQVWFQNQRTRQRRQSQLGPMSPLGEQQLNWQEQQTHAWTQESFQKQSRRKRTPISPSQTRILVEAFEKNRFPGMAARELLARQTGIPESRIQIWFQNRRAWLSAQQSSSGPTLGGAVTAVRALPVPALRVRELQAAWFQVPALEELVTAQLTQPLALKEFVNRQLSAPSSPGTCRVCSAWV